MNELDGKPLIVNAFLDGRPGHEKQTKGILAALGRHTTIQVSYRTVAIGGFRTSAKAWIDYKVKNLFNSKTGARSTGVDLTIGTGTHTHIPMLHLKRTCRVKAVTCMTPSFLLKREFDLCLIPQHDGVAPMDNLFITNGPPNSASFTGMHQSDRGLILIGGIDTKSHCWDPHRLLQQVRLILDWGSGMEWTISSSPRTPQDTIDRLSRLSETVQNVRFFQSKDTPSQWIEEQYAANQTVWVSADSVSMVYEAITAGCHVGILPVRWKRESNKIKRSIDRLLADEWVTAFEDWQSDRKMRAPVDRLDEADRCAREILKRWWPNRLK